MCNGIKFSLLLLVVLQFGCASVTEKKTPQGKQYNSSTVSFSDSFSAGLSDYNAWTERQSKAHLVSALAHFERAYSLYPDNVRLQYYYYRSLLALGLLNGGAQLIKIETTFARLNPSLYPELVAPAYLEFLLAQQDKVDPSVLFSLLRKAMQQNPYSAMNWNAMAQVMSKEKSYDMAIAAAAVANHMQPNTAEYLYQLGDNLNLKAEQNSCVYEEKSLISQSARYLAKAASLQPENYGFKQYAAIQYLRLGILPLSQQLSKQAFQQAHSYWNALTYAESAILLDNLEEAKEVIELIEHEYSKELALRLTLMVAILEQDTQTLAEAHQQLDDIGAIKQLDIFSAAMLDMAFEHTAENAIVKNELSGQNDMVRYLYMPTKLRQKNLMEAATTTCNLTDIHFLMALTAFQKQEYEKAIKHLRLVKELKNTRQTSFHWAHVLWQKSEIQQQLDAFEQLKVKAQQGDNAAQSQLAAKYLQGFLITPDKEKALHFAQLAANQNNTDAMVLVYELTGSKNQQLLKTAAEHKNARAMYLLSASLQGDPSAMFRLIKSSAELDYPPAMAKLANLYFQGEIVERDLQQAYNWYYSAAQLGHSEAAFRVGKMAFEGVGTEENFEVGLKYIYQAAHALNAQAQEFLGMFYHFMISDVDYREAAFWYMHAAAQGLPLALNNLGDLYENGQGVAQDYQKAHELYQSALKQGSKMANLSLAMLYVKGLGVKQNQQVALEYLQAGAKEGHASSQLELAKWYAHGRVVKQSAINALAWLHIAKSNTDLLEYDKTLFEKFQQSVSKQQLEKQITLLQSWLSKQS
ncbi:tetratricopeptide repeat protein [Catenovulum sediminis]|uniref:Tetratricopeptide repeat protein n=1 Tax=Catenovulum sediminis TaxID=1740262 RepID=A0ABV1RMG6_9ALTE